MVTEEQLIAKPIQKTTEKPLEVRRFFGWGHQANEQCKESFVVISGKKGYPYPGCKGFRLLWIIGGVLTDKEISNKSESEPVVGDVSITIQDEKIEIVSVDYA